MKQLLPKLSDLNEVRKRFTKVNPDLEIAAIHQALNVFYCELLKIWVLINKKFNRPNLFSRRNKSGKIKPGFEV
jgi:hypothetical protein